MTITLYDHQRKGLDLLASRKRPYLAWEMGTGKTITVLAHCDAVPVRTLILCPRSVMRAAWVADARHFPALRVAVLHGTVAERRKALASDWNVGITTYETFKREYKTLAALGIGRLVIDEASKCKAHDSQISKAAFAFSRLVDRVIMLSGTPAPNCPSEWWSQTRCLSPTILGDSYWSMVNRYFTPQRRTLRDGRQVVERLTQTPDQRAAFAARIAPWVDRLEKKDCLTLPPVTDQIREVELSADEWSAYTAAEKAFRLELAGGEVVRIKAEAALGKLRQLAGGCCYTPENGLHRTGGAKIGALLDVIDEIGHDEPVVIWAEFTHEIDRIAQATDAAIIDGRTKDAGAIVAEFQAGRIKRLVCHPAAAGHGITLTRACYAVYFSCSFSLEQWEQSRARLDRAGQTRPVTNIILQAVGTVDESIGRALRGKRRVFDEVLEAIRGRTTYPQVVSTG